MFAYRCNGIKSFCRLAIRLWNGNEAILSTLHLADCLVSKYDLGKFIIDSLEQPEHYGKVCGIGKAPKSA